MIKNLQERRSNISLKTFIANKSNFKCSDCSMKQKSVSRRI